MNQNYILSKEEIQKRMEARSHGNAPIVTMDEIGAMRQDYEQGSKNLHVYAKEKGLPYTTLVSWFAKLERMRKNGHSPKKHQLLPQRQQQQRTGTVCPHCGQPIVLITGRVAKALELFTKAL
jgi:hypothetical protein